MTMKRMFSGISDNYDILNRLISFGLDEGWRKKAAGICCQAKPGLVVDIGTGTGDLAFHIESILNSGTRVIALDFSEDMLDRAREKGNRKGSRVGFVLSDVVRLPFSNGSVDCITASFSFRNLTYRNPNTDDYLSEIHRVLSPGGSFIIVESSQPDSNIFKKLFHIYALYYVTFVGSMISGNRTAYRYLGRSMANYYTPKEVRDLITKAGFKKVEYQPLSLGLAGIHVARK